MQKNKEEKMRTSNEQNQERMEIIQKAVEEGAKTKKEICNKTGLSYYVVNKTLEKFPEQTHAIQETFKSKSQNENKETRKESTKNKLAVLDVTMLNVENVTSVLQKYMDAGIKIGLSNMTIIQIKANKERKNENGEKTEKAKRASTLIAFCCKQKAYMEPILITEQPYTQESLLRACKKRKEEVILLTGSRTMELLAWTFGIKSKKYTQKGDVFPEIQNEAENNFAETMVNFETERCRKFIKTLPHTSFLDERLYLDNEFDLIEVKNREGTEKNTETRVELEPGDYVYIACKKRDNLLLEYFEIIRVATKEHAKRIYRKKIYSFEQTTTINNQEFKKFADKAVQKFFER